MKLNFWYFSILLGILSVQLHAQELPDIHLSWKQDHYQINVQYGPKVQSNFPSWIHSILDHPNGGRILRLIRQKILVPENWVNVKQKQYNKIILKNIDLNTPYYMFEGVYLTPKLEQQVFEISKVFQEQDKNYKLVVTSGLRTPMKQASALLYKLRKDEDLTLLYRQGDLAKEVMNIYEKYKKESDEIVVEKVANCIEGQVRKNRYLSSHLRAGAVDFRNKDMSQVQKELFKKIISQQNIFFLIEEATPPHFHLQYK